MSTIIVDLNRKEEIYTAMEPFGESVAFRGFDKQHVAPNKVALVYAIDRAVIDAVRTAIEGIGIFEAGLASSAPAMMESCTSSS